MVRTQVQLTEDQARALRRLAVKQNTSLAALIRKGVDTVLRTSEATTAKEREERALSAAGKFRSGKSDLSLAHDEYLGETFDS